MKRIWERREWKGRKERVAGEDETEGNQQAERGAGYWKEQEMVHEIGDTLLELHRATTEPLRVLARKDTLI